jgi:hypothetical protein
MPALCWLCCGSGVAPTKPSLLSQLLLLLQLLRDLMVCDWRGVWVKTCDDWEGENWWGVLVG